ncbi:MAG: YihY/virulence factor BrkB family protein, partial [Clostridiales bacterium]|nr:YihY/virulence factor BrkB family protein [Candidatus Blautia equi]
ISNGLNIIFRVKETRSWLINRIYSIIWTVLFVVVLIGCLFLLVLGNQIQIIVARYIPFLGMIIRKILDQRTLILLLVLFVIFELLYKVLPNRKTRFRNQIPGAVFTSVSWLLLSDFISVYFRIFPGFENMYGSLAMILLILLWLDVCMILLLWGAEINAYFENR